MRPTKRAPDGWDSPRFLELVLNFGSFPFASLSPQSPVPITALVKCGDKSLVVGVNRIQNKICRSKDGSEGRFFVRGDSDFLF